MTSTRNLLLPAVIALSVTLPSSSPRSSSPPTSAPVAAAASPSGGDATALLAKLPLRFEANAGQWDPRVRFAARQGGATLFITDEGMTIGLRSSGPPPRTPGMWREEARAALEEALSGAKTAAISIKLVGTDPRPPSAITERVAPTGEKELITKSNFFLGNDPEKWRTNVPNYALVRAKGSWVPGVDVVWHGGGGGPEYDLEIAPGVDARKLAFEIEGADRIRVTEDGSLEMATAAGTLIQRPPRVVQDGLELRARYAMRGARRVAFAVDGYDATRALLIDPVLRYSTYLGGTGSETASAIAVDSSGNAYVTGFSTSTDFPTASPPQGNNAGSNDVFVTKLDASGTALVYSTYLGGSGTDYGYGIAVDAAGSAYVVGDTPSTNFPTASAYQKAFGGGTFDGFVTKLSPTGSALVYSTYLGGSGGDIGYGVAVDSAGSAYVTGYTLSTDFPTANPYQPNGGTLNAFVTKLSPTGSALVYSTYLGGSGSEEGTAIAVDSAGSAYATGHTSSTDFPIVGAYQGSLGGAADVYVTKLNAAGSALVYSTYLGGGADDDGQGIAVDSAGSAYVTGVTASTNFPTASAYQGTFGGTDDAFVAKLSASGSTLVYSTYLGGSGDDRGQGIAVDSAGSAYATGYTYSPNFPIASAYQGANGGVIDVFVTKLSASGAALTYSTYLGGSSQEFGQGIALDAAGYCYVAGVTQSTDFPTASAYHGTLLGITDAFVAKIGDPQLPAGATCAAAGECAAGLFCIDGVCCDTACTDQCAACDVSGHVGTCTPVVGPPHGSRTACGGGIGACASSCDGTNTKACSFPASSTVCASTCASGVETDSTCDGQGVCVAGSPRSCNHLTCTSDGAKCKASCASANDCISPYVCDSSGQCVAPAAGSQGCSCDTSRGSPPWGTALLIAAVGALLARDRRRGRARRA